MGQGLCSVGESYETVHIDTAVLGNNGDIFVGGSFETRVWDGKKFVYVNHVAMYDCKDFITDICSLHLLFFVFTDISVLFHCASGKSDSWLPLPESNGLLGCKDGTKPKYVLIFIC